MNPVMAVESDTLAPARAERERVLRVLRAEAPRLRGPESDIDLLIEVDPDADLGFFELFDLQEALGTRLGRRVQFAFASEMRPWLREWIEEDRIAIF
jgi:predicted nucleotidyltransferase